MDRLAALTARLLRADVALVSMVDDRCQFFPGQFGLSDPWSTDRETPLSQSLCKLVVTSDDVVQIDDTSVEPSAAEARRVLGVGAYLGAPLRDLDAHVLGSLCAITANSRRWTLEDRETLVDLAAGASSELRARIAGADADQARRAAERAELRAELNAERLRVLADASERLSESLEPDDALTRMLALVVPARATWAIMFLNEPTTADAHVVAGRHADDRLQPVLDGLIERHGQELLTTKSVRAVLTTGQPILVAHGTRVEHEPSIRRIIAELGVGDAILVPLISGGSTLGVLAVVLSADRGHFDTLDVSLLAELGRRGGAALGNARRFDRERQIALELQHGLLPTLPAIDSIEYCAAYEPAANDAEVGGDWYDVIQVGDAVVVVIGDVTGHNIVAAAAMGRIQGAIRAYALEDHRPNVILELVDRSAGHLVGDLYATCVIVRLERDPGGWRCEIANAGHPWPMIVDLAGQVRAVESGHGPLIGIEARQQRPVGTASVRNGETLLLYTDGLIERRRETVDAGLERLRLGAAAIAHDSIHSACKILLDHMQPDRVDDLAVVAIRPHARADTSVTDRCGGRSSS